MSDQLPGYDDVFQRFLLPWYSEADHKRRHYKLTRPDFEGWAQPGCPIEEARILVESSEQKVAKQIDAMLEAAAVDWPSFLPVSGEIDLSWIEAFDAYFDAKVVAELINSSDPSDFSNDLVIFSCEFGAVLGHWLIGTTRDTTWLYDWPYWESAVYDVRNGYRLNVFHWAFKKFSDYGVSDGYRAKLLTAADLIRKGWQ